MFHFLNYNRLLILVSILFVSVGAFAKTQTYTATSYKEAQKAKSFIRFDMASTKLGLVTTSFQGYTKQFILEGEIQQNQLAQGAHVEFSVKDLDTDNGSRNEKMWDQILDYKNHPKIRLVIGKELPIDGESKSLPVSISLRGKEKSIMLTGKAQRTSQGIEFDFSGELSIKGLEIPDPSIVIASVRDSIKVTAHFIVSQP